MEKREQFAPASSSLQQSLSPALRAAGRASEGGPDTDPPTGGSIHCFSVVLVFLACIGGFLFGYDTGIISGSIVLITVDFDLRYCTSLCTSSALHCTALHCTHI